MKSIKIVKNLEEIIAPYKIVFPEVVEGGVNVDSFRFEKDQEVVITCPQFEVLIFSSYAQYLN